MTRGARGQGPALLQVCKSVNCCEPSYNQHSQGGRAKLLMLTLTDGTRECTAVELRPVPVRPPSRTLAAHTLSRP